MAVTAELNGKLAVVTITTDITDILNAVGISEAEKEAQAYSRVLAELSAAVLVHNVEDASLDAEAAAVAAEVAKKKAARPTGTLKDDKP